MSDLSINANPLLALDEGPPAFDRIRPEHVQPAVGQLLEDTTTGLEQIELSLDNPAAATWSNTIGALEALGQRWERIWSPVSHLMGVKNSDDLREAHEAVLADVVAVGLRMRQSRPIYEALTHIRQDETLWSQFDETQQRIVSKRIRDAELAGIALPESEQERFNKISERLSQLSTEFSNHVLDATRDWELVLDQPADVDGLPSSLTLLAAQSLQQPERGRRRAWRPRIGSLAFHTRRPQCDAFPPALPCPSPPRKTLPGFRHQGIGRRARQFPLDQRDPGTSTGTGRLAGI